MCVKFQNQSNLCPRPQQSLRTHTQELLHSQTSTQLKLRVLIVKVSE